MFPCHQNQAMHFGRNSKSDIVLLIHCIRRYLVLICPFIDDVNLDHLVMVLVSDELVSNHGD